MRRGYTVPTTVDFGTQNYQEEEPLERGGNPD